MKAISAARVRARRMPAFARGWAEIVTLTVSSACSPFLPSCPCPWPSASGSAQRLNLAVADVAHQPILVAAAHAVKANALLILLGAGADDPSERLHDVAVGEGQLDAHVEAERQLPRCR